MRRSFALCLLLASALSFAEPPVVKPRAPDRDERKPSSAALQCPPRVELPRQWQECTFDSECTLAGDACRTCGDFLPVNERYKIDATVKAAEANSKAKCVRTCEACNLPLKLTCRAKTCAVLPPNR